MAKSTRRPAPRIFTHEEKVRLVTEIERRYREGGGSLRAIAASVGATDSNYYNWLRAGIRPVGPLPAMRQVEVTALVPVAPAAVTVVTVAAPAPTPSAPAPALNLVAPGGYRLEGLGIESAAALLKALAC
ncbi:MAG: hypothetical protein JWM80_529 [Cyanobacteria bacterium RYN_339]|nr:hypothetical protein [Cyanobacteria bacterium RYN_339]